jgi:hypothetical protein
MVEQEGLAAQIMRALQDSGVPLAIRPEDFEFDGPEAATADHDEGVETRAAGT